MWNEFNIKTMPAETIVFRDGAFCADLSTLPDCNIDKTYELPVHVIYVGEIAGKCRLDLNISADNQSVILDVRVKNNLPAFFDIFIKNTGKNSEIRGGVLLENSGDLTYNITGQHAADDTTICVKTKLVAEKNTKSKLSGTAEIEKDTKNAISDIAFAALADKTARIEFVPAQRISSVPKSADHSAAIFRPTDFQIEYLREAGLSGAEVIAATREAFMNDL